MDSWSTPRRALAAGALAVALAVAAWAWPVADAYIRAAGLFAEVVLERRILPSSIRAVEEEVHWPGGGYGLLTRPDRDGTHPGLLLMLGAEPAAPDDPIVRRLTTALARAGFVALLARSEPLIDGRVTPDEIPLLVDGWRAMREHPSVRDDRAGFVGLSVGGSIEVVAAADAAIADEVWMVLAIGPYYDAATLTAEVMSRAYRTPAGIVLWEPHETSVRVVSNTLLAALPAEEAETIHRGGTPDSDQGRIVRALLDRPPLDDAEALLAEFDGNMRERLAAISPSGHLDGLRAPLYLLHDRDDPLIPITHSESLAAHGAAQPPGVLRTYHRLEIFQHVEPKPASIGVLTRDGWRMLHLFAGIIRDGRR